MNEYPKEIRIIKNITGTKTIIRYEIEKGVFKNIEYTKNKDGSISNREIKKEVLSES